MINIGKFSKIFFGVNNLKNPKNNQNKKISKALAFSLIELSIVLIIIGLLVAGVTGGKSLIDSARQRAFINELNNYKQAVYTFRVAKDRLPGDLNNIGIIGECVGGGCPNSTASDFTTTKYTTYSTSDFPSPYNSISANAFSAPFIELFLEKIIDFRPDPNLVGNGQKSSPRLKYFNKGVVGYRTLMDFKSTENDDYHLNNSGSNSIYLIVGNTSILPNTLKSIDKKLDDGIYNSGILRGACGITNDKDMYHTSYEDSINGNGRCVSTHYFVK